MCRTHKFLHASLLCISFFWSSSTFAVCTPSQVSGVWETVFGSGNSCRLKLKNNGVIDAGKSVCYDPDRGSAEPDSGKLKVANNCFAEGEIVLGGVTIELYVQFSNDRTTGAGRVRIPDDGLKGSVVMIRVP